MIVSFRGRIIGATQLQFEVNIKCTLEALSAQSNLLLCCSQLQQIFHTEKSIEDSFQIWRNLIVLIVFLLIMNQTEIRLFHDQKKNCHYDRIPLNLKGIRKRFPWVYRISKKKRWTFCELGRQFLSRESRKSCNTRESAPGTSKHGTRRETCFCFCWNRLESDYLSAIYRLIWN